jgi:DNA-directed RNA polymerase specialized sigma24 family protein
MLATPELENFDGARSILNRIMSGRVREAMQCLPERDGQLLCWLYGVGCEQVSPLDVGEHLRISTDEVTRRAERALSALGSLLVQEAA